MQSGSRLRHRLFRRALAVPQPGTTVKQTPKLSPPKTARPTNHPIKSRPEPQKPRASRAGVTPGPAAETAAPSRRKLYVFASLVGVMTLTSALLWAMQVSPLSPDVSRTLSATDRPDDMNRVFDTATK